MNRLERIKSIGFNQSVVVGGRTLHVQTEVLVRDQIVARTMVLEDGVIRFADRHPCPPELQDPLELETYVGERHATHVEAVKSGKVG